MAGFFKSIGNFFKGTPGKNYQMSTLRPEQEGLYSQLQQAGMHPGAGGAFGQSADYYRGLLGNNSQDYQSFAAPAMRQYSEDIAPGISEQFAGMGSGGLSSSGFQNAQNQAGVDLAERLGQIRANLRHSGAHGLQNIGTLGLQNYSQNVQQQGTPGFLQQIAPAIGTAAGAYFGGPAGAMAGNSFGNSVGNWFGGSGNKVGQNSSPYGAQPKASPTMQSPGGSNMRGY